VRLSGLRVVGIQMSAQVLEAHGRMWAEKAMAWTSKRW